MSKEVEVLYEGAVVTRKEAVAKGLKKYFTGEACRNGHIAQRASNSGSCCECKRLWTQKWREENKDKGNCEEYQHKPLPSLEDLNRWFTYEPDTGRLFWNKRCESEFYDSRIAKGWNTRFAGKEAGAKHYANGYIEVRTPDKKLYKAQRIAWKMYYQEEPTMIVDHKNGVPYDNRIDNLRLASHQGNSRNMKSVGVIPYKGVTFDKKTGYFVASFCEGDNSTFKRDCLTAEEAALWYDKQIKSLYGEFANLNFPEDEVINEKEFQ